MRRRIRVRRLRQLRRRSSSILSITITITLFLFDALPLSHGDVHGRVWLRLWVVGTRGRSGWWRFCCPMMDGKVSQAPGFEKVAEDVKDGVPRWRLIADKAKIEVPKSVKTSHP